jgi:uncharacterized protein (DUF1501 family)
MFPLPGMRSRVVACSRRALLQAGSLTFFGLTLPQLLRARATASGPQPNQRRIRGVILAHLTGGLSHLDSLDPKPDAPQEIRGSFSTIATALPGIRFTEHLPRLAQALGDMTLIRSMRTMTLVHEPAVHRLLCGVDQTPPGTGNTASRRDRPHLGSLLALSRPDLTSVPPCVVLPTRLRSLGNYPGQNAGFLGARYDPWFVTGDPAAANFGPGNLGLPEDISVNRLSDRDALLASIDRLERSAPAAALAAHHQQAIGILTANTCRDAFELGREHPTVRERYGRNRMGQGLLLARRLVEAGVPLIQVNMGQSEAWDTHADSFTMLSNQLLPPLDRGLSALLEDLTLRGLRDEVLVVVATEFGRAPRVGLAVPGGCGAAMNGRDHWAGVFSILAFGAGVGRGQVLGASDRFAAYPASASYTPADLGATILHALGVNQALVLRDDSGQSFLVNAGTPIAWG